MTCGLWLVAYDLWLLNYDFRIVTLELWLLNCDFWIVTFELWLSNCDFRIVTFELWLLNCDFCSVSFNFSLSCEKHQARQNNPALLVKLHYFEQEGGLRKLNWSFQARFRNKKSCSEHGEKRGTLSRQTIINMPWWWSNGQCSGFMLRQSEFNSGWLLNVSV